MTELQLQSECAVWFQNTMYKHRGYFRRVKNETDAFISVRSRIAQGMQNKSTGIVAGTWDSFLMVEPILWIEFKVGTNGLSPPQKEFMRIGLILGWRFKIVKILEQFQTIVYDEFT